MPAIIASMTLRGVKRCGSHKAKLSGKMMATALRPSERKPKSLINAP